MKLSVVIPCYNERKTIRSIVEAVRGAPVADKEIIVVDDCSTDGTRDILKAEIEPLVSQVIHHPMNCGNGAALRTGFAATTGKDDLSHLDEILALHDLRREPWAGSPTEFAARSRLPPGTAVSTTTTCSISP